MITSISREQAERGRQLRDEWIGRALATGPTDREEAERGFALAYQNAGLGVPQVMWFPSPMRGLVNAAIAVMNGNTTISTKIFENEIRDAYQILVRKLDARVIDVLERELAEPVRKRNEHVVRAVMMELIIRAGAVGAMYPKTEKILQKLLEVVNLGSLDANRLVLHDYADRVLGIAGCARMRGLVDALRAGWYWTFRTVVVATELPSKIVFDDKGLPHSRDSSAIEYKDGFEIYCRHGVRIPPEAIADTVQWGDIQVTAEKNVQNALAEMKAEKWSAADPKVDESEQERYEAALAVKRLGGVAALKELVEEKE